MCDTLAVNAFRVRTRTAVSNRSLPQFHSHSRNCSIGPPPNKLYAPQTVSFIVAPIISICSPLLKCTIITSTRSFLLFANKMLSSAGVFKLDNQLRCADVTVEQLRKNHRYLPLLQGTSRSGRCSSWIYNHCSFYDTSNEVVQRLLTAEEIATLNNVIICNKCYETDPKVLPPLTGDMYPWEKQFRNRKTKTVDTGNISRHLEKAHHLQAPGSKRKIIEWIKVEAVKIYNITHPLSAATSSTSSSSMAFYRPLPEPSSNPRKKAKGPALYNELLGEHRAPPTQSAVSVPVQPENPYDMVSREIDSYLATPALPQINYQRQKLDVLAFWKYYKKQYPTLAALARVILAVPASSASAERVFSAAGRIVTKFRCNIDSDLVNALVMLANIWEALDEDYPGRHNNNTRAVEVTDFME